jgi:Glycosyltransferase family 87
MPEVRTPSPVTSWGRWRRVCLLVLSSVLGLGMVYYVEGVLVPIRRSADAIAAGGNWSDLYPRWLGSRELLLHHRNPYSRDVTRDIQKGFYGFALDSPQNKRITNQQPFAYPVYIAFLLAPSFAFPFATVQVVFLWTMFLATLASVPMWISVLGGPWRLWTTWLALVGAMSSFAVVDALHLDQPALLVAALMGAGLALLSRGWHTTAGVLLALATIKPQAVALLVTFLLIWTLGQWKTRKSFLIGFSVVMFALLLGSEIVLPGWFGFWLQALRDYVRDNKPSPLAAVLGRQIAAVVTMAAAGLCVALFWRFRKQPPGSKPFTFALVCALVLTEIVLPTLSGSYYNQLILIPVAIWLFASGFELAQETLLARVMWWATVGVLVGQWLVALAVSFASLVLGLHFQSELSYFVAGPEFLTYMFPLVLALFVLSAAPQMWRSRALPDIVN